MTLLTDNPDDSGTANGQSSNEPDNTTTTQVEGNEFLSSLNEDLRSAAPLQTFKDVNSLAQSYIHAQSMIGRDKIAVPTKHASPEDWKDVFTKLGLPEKEAYKLEGLDPENATEFDKTLQDFMYENNLLPNQANALYKFLSEQTNSLADKEEEDYNNSIQEGLNNLKNEWGNAYDQNIKLAQRALSTYADDGMINYLRESGLGNDPILIKLFNQVGKGLGEDKMLGDSTPTLNTPAEAQKKIDSIMDNPNHPYHDQSHMGHDNAVKEMENLFKDLTSN